MTHKRPFSCDRDAVLERRAAQRNKAEGQGPVVPRYRNAFDHNLFCQLLHLCIIIIQEGWGGGTKEFPAAFFMEISIIIS